MASGAGRTDRTPYFILALSFLITAVGGYYWTRETDNGKIAGLTERVRVLEETIPLRRQMRDLEMRANAERDDQQDNRLRVLEAGRAGR